MPFQPGSAEIAKPPADSLLNEKPAKKEFVKAIPWWKRPFARNQKLQQSLNGFFTKGEQQDIQDNSRTALKEVMAERPEGLRSADEAKPDHLRVGTDAYRLRQVQGGNYLIGLDALQQIVEPIEKAENALREGPSRTRIVFRDGMAWHAGDGSLYEKYGIRPLGPDIWQNIKMPIIEHGKEKAGGDTFDPNAIRAKLMRVQAPLQETVLPDTNPNTWYDDAMMPAMDRLLRTGLFDSIADFKPSTLNQPFSNSGTKNLENALDALWTTVIPPNLAEKVRQGAQESGQEPTIGVLLSQLAHTLPDRFQELLGTAMAAGFEGYTVAATLAQTAYGQEVSPSQPPEDSRDLQQKNIPPILALLLRLPLPEAWTKENPRAYFAQYFNVPTIGDILARMNKPEGENLLEALGQEPVARIIGAAAWQQIQKG